MMKKYLISFLLFLASLPLISQDIKTIGMDGLIDELGRQSDTVYIYNFWATWCKPCTEEMPDLLKLEEEYSDKKIKLVLISLDMPSQKDTRLAKFINDHGIGSQVLLLDEPDGNKWIPLVDESWSGSIPATLISAPQSGYRDFHEGMLSYDKLKSKVEAIIE